MKESVNRGQTRGGGGSGGSHIHAAASPRLANVSSRREVSPAPSVADGRRGPGDPAARGVARGAVGEPSRSRRALWLAARQREAVPTKAPHNTRQQIGRVRTRSSNAVKNKYVLCEHCHTEFLKSFYSQNGASRISGCNLAVSINIGPGENFGQWDYFWMSYIPMHRWLFQSPLQISISVTDRRGKA